MQSSILVGTGTFHLTRSHLIFIVLYMLKRYTELLVRKYEGITEKSLLWLKYFQFVNCLRKDGNTSFCKKIWDDIAQNSTVVTMNILDSQEKY